MRRSSTRRAVVTGVGLLTPLGWGTEEHRSALDESRSGLRVVDAWAELGLRTAVGGLIDDGAAKAASALPARRLQTMGPLSSQAVLAAEAAVADAGLDGNLLGRDSTACIVGAGVGSMPAIYEGARLVFDGRARRVRPHSILQSMSSAPSAHLTHAFGIGGRSYTVASACASSAHAIGTAFEMIGDGRAEIVLTGGSEEINEILVAAFEALRTALSGETDPRLASMPFDARRTGLVLAGGAAMLVVEERRHALERGATVWGEILGYGTNSEAHDLVLPEPTGRQAAACMRQALRSAAIEPCDVDYVNAHATGTPAGDLAEARALRDVFLPQAPDGCESELDADTPLVGSTKALLGHTLGAAGAIEAALSLLMLRDGRLAAMPEFESGEAEMPRLRWLRRPTPLERDDAKRRICLSNSFGFGGTNASLVLAEADVDDAAPDP